MGRFERFGEAKLDLKDRKILLELDMDARQGFSQIAKKVGLSKQGVEYKVRKLIADGVITGFYPIVNMPKLGYTYCRLTLVFENAPREKQEEIISYLTSDPRWFWVFTTQGAIDLLAVMWVKSLSEFYGAVNELLGRHGSYIREHGEQVATDVIHLQQRFLLGGGERKRIDIRETSKRVAIDGLDMDILRALADNARMPLVEIASRVGESAKVVAYRIRRMERAGVIAGYRANLDTKKLEFIWYKIWMHAKKRPGELMRRIATNPYVSYIVEEVGLPEEIDFEIMVEKTEDLFDFVKELRDSFPTTVGTYRTFMYTGTRKVRYIPF